jgi:cytochrome c-type biogenesis protein CcmH/NrfG
MTSGESKKLTIAVWALTTVMTISIILDVAAYYVFPEIMSEVEQAFDDSELSSQYKEHYLKNELEVLRNKVTDRISTHPNDEYGYYYLGLVLYKEGAFEQAYINFTKASELDPTWESALNYMELSANR